MLEGRDIFIDEKGVEYYPIFSAARIRLGPPFRSIKGI
jgi:hypothetical protein